MTPSPCAPRSTLVSTIAIAMLALAACRTSRTPGTIVPTTSQPGRPTSAEPSSATARFPPALISLDPTYGPPGTLVTLVGADSCPPPPGATDPQVTVVLLSPAGSAVARLDAAVALDGSWRGQLVIPAVGPGRYTVMASCTDAAGGAAYTAYRPEPWQVTADLTAPP